MLLHCNVELGGPTTRWRRSTSFCCVGKTFIHADSASTNRLYSSCVHLKRYRQSSQSVLLHLYFVPTFLISQPHGASYSYSRMYYVSYNTASVTAQLQIWILLILLYSIGLYHWLYSSKILNITASCTWHYRQHSLLVRTTESPLPIALRTFDGYSTWNGPRKVWCENDQYQYRVVIRTSN